MQDVVNGLGYEKNPGNRYAEGRGSEGRKTKSTSVKEEKHVSDKTDCHVHTILSGHAYSTVEECAIYAGEAGTGGIVITDHFCPIREEEFGDKIVPIINLTVLPPYIQGVRVMRGMEADILDLEGIWQIIT